MPANNYNNNRNNAPLLGDAYTPYNFVPLPERIVAGELPPTACRFHAKRYTGWLDVTYATLTPLYTRAATRVSANYASFIAAPNSQAADFYHYGDKSPVLPGSGLRGMFRAVFELMTYSKMEFVSDRRLFYRTFASGQRVLRELYNGVQEQNGTVVTPGKFDKRLLVGGRLRDDNGQLVLDVHTDINVPSGFVVVEKTRALDTRYEQPRFKTHPVQFALTGKAHAQINAPIATIAAPGIAGRLIVPGRDVQERRWYQIIAIPQPSALRTLLIEDNVYKDYLAWGDMAHGQKFQAGDPRTPPRLKAGDFAFALLEEATSNKVAVVGANMMMALRYEVSIRDVAQKDMDMDMEDMTDCVFGYVRQEKVKTVQTQRTRVFFEDAGCGTTNPWMASNETDSVKVPNVLSGPKPTAIQTYLVQYDENGNAFPPLSGFSNSDSRQLRHWSHPDAQIRGFKRYWHRTTQAAATALNPNSDLTGQTQKTKIRPVKEGVVFTGRIRFENLSAEEFGALYATVQLPKGLAHKFGMGKNLGLGSLEVNVTRTVLLNMPERYQSFGLNAGQEFSGQRTPEETTELLTQAYMAFLTKMFDRPVSLWHSVRMRALAALLMVPAPLEDSMTEQIGIGKKDMTEYPNYTDPTYYTLEDRWEAQWKQRWLLPETQHHQISNLPRPTDIFALPTSEKEKKRQEQKEQAAKKVIPVGRVYKENEEFKVDVLARVGYTDADVRLPDGEEFAMQQAGMCEVGKQIKVRVLQVANGKVKKLKRL